MALQCQLIQLDFKKTLLRAVENGLLALGETPRHVILHHLEADFQLKRGDIPGKAEQFDRALNSIFGSGAEIIERYIVKDLYQRLKLSFEEKEDFRFTDYVRQAQLILSRRKKSEPEKARKAREGSKGQI